jgi:eukaryotic-like serine/threonine-protein kinase
MLGQVIHGYRIDVALSGDKGGFGDVYFATHVDSGAEAVIKVLKPEMSALHDIVARFFNEARAAASIHHPGIVQIHNVGYHRDRAYLLMERLRGADLESRLERGPLPIDRAVLFMRQAAGAIGAAHERGIVHRDLKPANLFIVEDPDVIGGERAKVLDFGIAKLSVYSGAGRTQGIFGSPPYMSPEQCENASAVDARSDLYSLGCIFYELVCGRPPFGHGSIELIAAHLRDPPAPPSAIAPWVPPAIERVILGLLEKQPDRRIPSCAALIAALDEATTASGMPSFSSPHLAVAAVALGTAPRLHGGARSYSSTTLGAAAYTAATRAPGKRRLGAWLGGAAVVVGAAVIAVTAAVSFSRRPAGNPNPSPPEPSSPGIASAPADASVATDVPDATATAIATPDAVATERSDAPVTSNQSECDKLDVDAIVTQAAMQNERGRAAEALALVKKAMACEPSPRLYRYAATYACSAHAFDTAALYIAKLPSRTDRSRIQQMCLEGQDVLAPKAFPSEAEIAGAPPRRGK